MIKNPIGILITGVLSGTVTSLSFNYLENLLKSCR